ncbi:MAG: beta-ketoacyl-[acyl-carrier-protein] synthase family protein [Candidatus Omnitrophota bacterium]
MAAGKNYKRVVITGLGVVSSLGIGWEDFWPNIMAGKSGISKIESFDTAPYDRHFGGEVKNFNPEHFIDKRKIPQLGRASQMAIAASKLALKDAKIKLDELAKRKCGVCIGTTMGESQAIESMVKQITDSGRFNAKKILILEYPADSIAANVSRYFGFKERSFLFANACAAGNYSIGYAHDLISSGKAEYMLAGGADALSRIAFTGFGRLYAMAPEKCQPFDKNRKGMMLGEGSGILFLESLDSAKKRKAHIYAEILGYGLSCDAFEMTAPKIEGVVKAMERSIKQSGIQKEEISYVSAHGTGTPENDTAECQAINKALGSNTPKVPVSSIKSMLGHTMGAAAALEAIACCLSIEKQEVPPTINLEAQDPECKIDCVPGKGRKHKVGTVLNNSQAFGGNNACVAMRRYAQ